MTIKFSGDDSLSDIASCTSTSYSGPDAAAASVSGTCTDAAGNTSEPVDFSLKYDATAPTSILATPDRDPNCAGWYNAPVTLMFSGEDATSGIASCTSTTYSGPDDAAASVSGSCTDNAGNSASGAFGLAYDATAPSVTYSGNVGTYTVDQTITITCTATDNLSGIASTTCQNITAPAYSFVVGANTVSSSATDNAGNAGSGSVTFTVTVTTSSLATLTQQFESNPVIARQLLTPLNGVRLAERLGNPAMKTAFLNTYKLLVNIQRGRTLTNEQADTLIALANSL